MKAADVVGREVMGAKIENSGADFALFGTDFKKYIAIMKHTGIVVASLLGGALIGSAIAVLFTPHSGPELRRRIRDFVDDEMDKVKEEFERMRCKCDEHGHCDCEN